MGVKLNEAKADEAHDITGATEANEAEAIEAVEANDVVNKPNEADKLGWECRELCLLATPPKQQTFVSVANMSKMSA